MLYKDFINNIIQTRGQWNIPKNQYFEKHHILPLCMGGTGDYKNSQFKKYSTHPNCIWLTAQEHYIAHKLLFEENSTNRSLALAWHNFHQRQASKNAPKVEVSADEYALLREAYASLQHEAMSGKNNPIFGHKCSEEKRQKLIRARQEQVTRQGEPHAGKLHKKSTKDQLHDHFITTPSHSTQIIDEQSGKIYVSKSDCIRSTGIGRKMLETCLNKEISWHEYQFRIYTIDKTNSKDKVKNINDLNSDFSTSVSHSTKVIDKNTGQIYISKSECRYQTGITARLLNKCLLNNIEWRGYKFEIYEKDKTI